MAIRKRDKIVFEDIIKVDDRIESFTIAQVDEQIAGQRENIIRAKKEIDRLEARKAAALAL